MSGAVFVTGATGTVGSAVTRELAARGQSVVAGVRSDDTSLPAGVEPRTFGFTGGVADMRMALKGCDRLFLMRPPPIADVERYLFPLIDAAKEAGTRQVVFLSLQGVQFNRSTPHHAVEQYLKTAGVPFTNLRPNFFMQNLSTTYRADIRDRDEIFVPAGRSRTAFVDAHDVGAVAAMVLSSPGHVGKSYTLSGERSLSYRGVADILSATLGRTITYARPSESDYLDRLRDAGAAADYVDVQRMIYRVVRSNASALPNRSVRQLTGRPATSFEQFAVREGAAWQR